MKVRKYFFKTVQIIFLAFTLSVTAYCDKSKAMMDGSGNYLDDPLVSSPDPVGTVDDSSSGTPVGTVDDSSSDTPTGAVDDSSSGTPIDTTPDGGSNAPGTSDSSESHEDANSYNSLPDSGHQAESESPYSSPVFVQKKETSQDVFEEGISLSERVDRIWQSLNDKEKKFLEIGGTIIVLDVVYHIIKALIKSIIKSKKKINNSKDNKKNKEGKNSDFERPELEFEAKSVVTCLRDTVGNRDLVDYFNKKKFIEEKAIGFEKYDELEEKLNDKKADLIVLDLNTMEEFEEFKKLSSEKDSFALIVDDSIYKDIEAELNSIKEEKKITGFVPETAKKEAKLIKLVLPLFKPEINGENAAELIGSVADALGIPYVSDIIDAAMNGKEVIDTVKEGDMDAVDKANVIGGIAAILGFDSVQEITDIIDKVSTAKSVVNHETIDVNQDATVNKE